jgi:hypothetical protein
LQVRKLMVKLEQQQQQQQQDSDSSDQSDRDDCTNMLIASLFGMLSTIAVFERNEHINAGWRELAKPTAAVFEHFLHVQLLQHGAGLTGDAVSKLWDTCSSFLWGDTFGPLLMVALEETTEEAAATLAGTSAAAAAASAAEASACTAAAADGSASMTGALLQLPAPPAAAAAASQTAPQLFSLCISAVKLLEQQVHDPYSAIDPDKEIKHPLIAASVLEHVQQAAAAMLVGSTPSEALPEQQRSFRSLPVGLPWAVLLLRCLQLGLVWLQQAVEQLLANVESSSGNSRDAEAQQQQQQAWGDDEQQELLGYVVASIGQLEDGLYVLGLVLGKWCASPAAAAAEGLPTAEQPAAAVLMPLLQKQQQQLQLEVLPAVQQVVQLWAAGLRMAGRHKSIADALRSNGVLSRWHFSLERLTFAAFKRTGKPNAADSDYESEGPKWVQVVQRYVAQGIWNSTPQQQQAAVHALQQLLGSGKLQAWVAAASSALPLRWCCNNPGCSNLGTAGSKARGSELRRVAARQCSGCQSVCYCQKVSCSIQLSTSASWDGSAADATKHMAAVELHFGRVPCQVMMPTPLQVCYIYETNVCTL